MAGFGLASIIIQGMVLSMIYPSLCRRKSIARGALTLAGVMGLYHWTIHVLAAAAKHRIEPLSTWFALETTYLSIQCVHGAFLIALVHRSRKVSTQPQLGTIMREGEEELTERIRPLMKRRKGCSERKMFGGVCFMINGNMCVGPWKGALIVRLDKESHEDTKSKPHVRPMDITGRVMKGWALIEPAGIKSDGDLKTWIERAVKFARSLPAK